MTYEIHRSKPTEISVIVHVPWEELKPLLPKAAAKISEETEIEGFRKGKAPYEMMKAKVGEFKILEEAARRYIADNFEKLLAEVEQKEFAGKSFEPVGEPQVAITKLAPGDDLEFKITLSLLPPIELPDYRAIAKRVLATKRVPETTEKEVADTREWLRESRAKLVTVNRGAKAGDRVEVDFSTRMGGVALEGGESKNHPFVLGKGRFLPGFENQLLGMKAGEEKAFDISVPPDWRDRAVRGKVLEFKAKMNLVQERDVPAWGDEFAKSLGNFSSAAAVEASISDGLTMEKEEKEKERLRMAMAEAIAAETKAAIPEVLVERELEKMMAELQGSIGGMGMKFEDYLSHIRKTVDGLRREWRPDGERRVKIALVLREVAKREGIRPTEDEIQQAVDRTMAHRGMTEEDVKALDRKAFSEYHRGITRNEKVFQFLENLEPRK